MKCKKNKLWLENISNLFCTSNLIPLNGMSLAEQMNSLSRLVIIIFFVLFLFKFRFSGLFLLLSLLFIIILYYIQKNNMEQFHAEYYTPKKQTHSGCQTNFQKVSSKIGFIRLFKKLRLLVQAVGRIFKRNISQLSMIG